MGDTAFSIPLALLITLLSSIPVALVLFIATAPTRYNPDDFSDPQRSKRHASHKSQDGFERSSSYRTKNAKNSVQILVLGDIGRSPRMQYHAMSFARHACPVHLIGYHESDIHTSLTTSPIVTIIPLPIPPTAIRNPPRLLFPLLAPLKALHQSLSLYHALAYRSPPTKYTLLQNPPSIPTILIALATTSLRGTALLLDWHNLGYSVLALRFPKSPTHPLVRLAKLYELTLPRFAHLHLAVSAAMASFLRRSISGARTRPLVLRDRPAHAFRPVDDPAVRTATLNRIPETAPHADDILARRTRLIVSSTSWSQDEDFSILLDALLQYSRLTTENTASRALPKILAVITGKGPQKAHYLRRIATLTSQDRLENAAVQTAWLPHADYAALLASADLGVSLHASTSGLDLPMKVVDMFGAGLPVAGYDRFEAWGELVREGENGVGFADAAGLCGVLVRLFGDGEEQELLARLRRGARGESARRWDEEWDRVVGTALGLL